MLTAAYSMGRNPCKANNVVYVTVVDLCPGCQAQQLDLSREAFASIAGLGVGRTKIDFQPVWERMVMFSYLYFFFFVFHNVE